MNLIDLRHELYTLAGKIDWKAPERQFGGLYAAGVGRPDHPIRLIGQAIKLHFQDLSSVWLKWVRSYLNFQYKIIGIKVSGFLSFVTNSPSKSGQTNYLDRFYSSDQPQAE